MMDADIHMKAKRFPSQSTYLLLPLTEPTAPLTASPRDTAACRCVYYLRWHCRARSLGETLRTLAGGRLTSFPLRQEYILWRFVQNYKCDDIMNTYYFINAISPIGRIIGHIMEGCSIHIVVSHSA